MLKRQKAETDSRSAETTAKAGSEKGRGNQTDHNPGSTDNPGTGRQDESGTVCDRKETVHAGQDRNSESGN